MDNQSTYYVDLITRYFAGEIAPDEMLLLSEWLKAHPDNQQLFNDYQKTWEAIEESAINTTVNIDDEWDKLSSTLFNSTQEESNIITVDFTSSARTGLIRRFVRIAAIFILFAVSSFVVYYYFIRQQKPETIQLAAITETTESKLPDGSSVTLNTGSSISYPEEFEKDKRTVTLKGEAYFNVTPDKERPFIIAANDIRVEVLGTSFYVNTNAENGNVEVILTSGKVAVYKKDNPNNRTILEPGEKAEFSKADQSIHKEENDDQNYMAFKTKKLVFADTPLQDIISTLNEVYHSDIKLKEKKLANCRVTVTFNNQSLDAVLNILKATVNLNINKSGSRIEISGNGCN